MPTGFSLLLIFSFVFLSHVFQAQNECDALAKQREDDEQNVSAMMKKISLLEQELAEVREQLQDETKHKLAMQSRVRQLEDDLAESLEAREEMESKRGELEAVCLL